MKNIEETTRIKQFVVELNLTISSHYEIVKDIFNSEYGYPELDPVRDEICKCIICGLYQAAITLTNHLLEQSLKTCLIFKYSIEHKKNNTDVFDPFSEGIEQYDNIDLSKSINNACSMGLITKEQKQLLHEFRKDFRNAYSHASLEKTFGESKIRGKMISVGDFNSIDELSELAFDSNKDRDIELKSLPMTRGIAQYEFAKQDCVPYFRNVDEIIRTMLSNLKSNKQ